MTRDEKTVSELVSVIIPAYNAAHFIQEALDSVFAQTYPNYEVIVVNDGSPDTADLERVLSPYMDRLIYVAQENRGPAGARNAGLLVARGGFVALLDADDFWTADYLAEQVAFLQSHPEFDLCYCNARIIGDSIHSGKDYMSLCPSDGDATASAIISGRCHVFNSVIARRPALVSVAWDESLRSSEDFDCWLRFVAAGYRIGYQRKMLANYRRHKQSLSADPIWMAEHHLTVLAKAESLWPHDSEEGFLLRRAKDKSESELNLTSAKLCLRDGDVQRALLHLGAANATEPTLKRSLIIVLLRFIPAVVRAAYHFRRRQIWLYRDD